MTLNLPPHDRRFEGKGVIGSGLAVDGELVQLSAYGDAS
jgi:hypothetical protein